MEQTLQVAGALLILSAYILAQRGTLDTDSPLYLVLNLAGAATLTVVAALGRDWGFLLLEGVWALVSAYALARGGRAGRSEVPAPPNAS